MTPLPLPEQHLLARTKAAANSHVRQHTMVGGRDGATRVTVPGLVAASRGLA